MPALYRRRLVEFLDDHEEQLIGRLTTGSSDAGFFHHLHSQTAAWRTTIVLLKKGVRELLRLTETANGTLLLEYPIPRRGKRVDCVIVADSVVLILELKCGASEYTREAITQVEDYCLDLSDFHEASRGRPIVPMLVATEAPKMNPPAGSTGDPVKPTWLVNSQNLASSLVECVTRYSDPALPPIDPIKWDNSAYVPTPTIIEAAQALYAGQNVREIARCHSGIENLTITTETVIQAIEEARSGLRKRICFITGVPGAGKTLAGLNIVHNRELHEGDLGVFLSGNGPLVRVLTEALARDAALRKSASRHAMRRQVQTFIQNVHHFIDAYFADPLKIPIDKVVVFDEAQRAWDAVQSMRKFQRPFSEPEILLEVMDRHRDWAVIVALVGSGQEINRGEAGLEEWGRAITRRFPHWEVFISPELKVGTHSSGACLFPVTPREIRITENSSLHLKVNLRSYKAEVLSAWVDAILQINPHQASDLKSHLEAFPIVLTRDLRTAKDWLRRRQRGSRRGGIVASSGARRLKAHGLDVTLDLDVENWFLNRPDDVRSSHYLESVATEFGIQGLELDWTILCWGGDLIPGEAQWVCRSFRGTKWLRVHDDATRQYIINKYRVLLTRAREGTIIWIPPGDSDDATRPPAIYDRIADYLARCGIASLD